jgi:hypothetical protein
MLVAMIAKWARREHNSTKIPRLISMPGATLSGGERGEPSKSRLNLAASEDVCGEISSIA